MSYHYSNRHVYMPSSHTRVSSRPNLSWSTIREETSSDFLSTEQDEKKDRMSRLKKLERLKERRYMDYQSLKRRGNSKEYSDRFQRDCEEFNKLKYRQVHHTPNSMLFATGKHRSVSVSDMTSKRHMYSSRYGHTHLRGNQDDGQTLSPTGSISSIVTLDDDYMYGTRYRTSSFSSSMGRDRLSQYGLSTHEMLDDNLFDDTSSEYSFSGYVPQRRAFSSCVTPRRYSGLLTPTADSADAAATVERMGQLQERLKLLQTERSQLERRRSVDLSSSIQMRSRLSSFNTETTSASTHGKYGQESQTILPQSPTDPSIPPWTQRVNLLLSQQEDATDFSPDMDYGSSHSEIHHVEPAYSYTTSSVSKRSSDILDSVHYAESPSNRSYHSVDSRESLSSYSSPHSLSRTTSYQRQNTMPYGASPTRRYQDEQQLQTSYTNSQQVIDVTNTNQNVNLQRPGSLFPRAENSNHGADQNSNSQRTTEESHYSGDMSPSPLSPGSYNENFATIYNKTLIVRGQQVSQQPSQDDISDSGVDSSSDVGRVSGSVSNDSISKFVVSASKPSESRGRTKFEIALGSPGQKAGSYELSPEDAAYHSVQESPQEVTSKDVQDSDSYHYTTRRTLRKYDNTPQSVEYDHPHDSKTQTETIFTGKYNTKTFASSDSSLTPENQSEDISQQQSTKTITFSQIGSAQKKNVSSDKWYAERKSSPTVNEDLVAKRSKELAEQYFGQFYQKRQSLNLQSGEKQPEDNVHNSTETVTFNISSTDVASRDSMSLATKSDTPKDNSSIFEKIDSETKGMENNTTTTTVVKTVDNYSTETKEQDIGTYLQYNQDNVETLQSTDPTKVSVSEVVITTDSVSETMPSVGKSESIENHSEIPADKNTKNVSKVLNQVETSQIVFKNVSEELQSADVLMQKSVEKPVPETKYDSISAVESTVSEEQITSDLNVITPKRKRSKKKKSLKGGENNGLDSKPKTEEELTSTSETVVNLEFVSSSVDNGNLNQPGMVSNEQPINGSKNGSHPGTIQPKSSLLVQSPSEKKSFKSSKGIIISKEEFQTMSTDVTTNVTIVETKQMMDATRETLNKLQSGEQSSLADEDKEIAPSATSAKLATVGYQTTTSVDNVNIQDPGRKSQEKLPDITMGMPGKMEEQNLKLETAEGTFLEKEGTAVPSKGKSKKKKKNSFRNSKKDEQSESAGKFLGKIEDTALAGGQEQGDMFGKVTTTTKTVTYKTSERPEEYNRQNISVEFPGQMNVPQQTEFTQGNMTDKVATISNTVAYKTSEVPENYNPESMSIKFPGQQIELGKDKEMFTEVTTTTKTISDVVDSEMLSGPEVYNVQPVNGKFQDPKSVGSQGDKFGKVTTTTKTVAFKTSERPEEYNGKNISVEFPGQVKAPQQMEFTQGNMTDKVATTINTLGFKTSEKPEDRNTESMSVRYPGQQIELGKDGEMFTKVTTTVKTTSYEMDTGMLSGPEVYNVQPVNGKFPGKAEDPKLVGSVEQGDMFGKVTTTTKTVAYKTSEKPEEYNVQNISAEFPGQVKAPQQMEFTQGNMVDKVKTISNSAGYKMAPEMSERLEEYRVQSFSAEFPGQVKFPEQQTELGKDGEIIKKVTTTTKTTLYEVESGLGSNVQENNSPKVSFETKPMELPLNSEDPNGTEGSNSSFFGRVASTLKSTFSMSPSSPNKSPSSPNLSEFTIPPVSDDSSSVDPVFKTSTITKVSTTSKVPEGVEDYNAQSISSEFPEQVKVPQQTEFTQGNLTDKVATITNTLGYKTFEKPENYSTESISVKFPGQQIELGKDKEMFTKVTTTTKTTSYEMDTEKLSGPEVYNVQPVNGKREDPKLVGSVEQGDMFGKVTTTTKTIAYKTSEKPEEYNIKNITAEFPGQVKAPQQMEFTQDNMVDKVKTINVSAGYKMAPEMLEKPEEYHVQSFSAEFPGQKTSPMQTDFTQGNIVDKIVSTTVSTDRMVPEMSDMTGELKVQSMSVEFPNQVSTSQEPLIEDQNISSEVVTTTETISEKIVPVLSTSELHQEPEFIEQGDVSHKVMTPSKDATFMTDKSISMRIEALKAQTMSAEFPGMQVELEKTGMATEVNTTTESPKEKSKSPGKSPSKSKKKGSKKTPEECEVSNVEPVPAETAPQSKDKQKKEKSGFLGKVATSIKSSFSKKSRGGSIKSEDFPELVKDSSNVQLNAANVPNDSSKVSYKSVVESDTVKTISDDLDGKVTVTTKTANLTESGEQPDLAEKVITISTTETSVSKVSETPEQYNIGSVSAEFPGQGPQQTEFTQDNLAEKSVTEIKMAANQMFPEMTDQSEEHRIKSLTAEFPGQQIDLGKDGETFSKVTTTTKTTSYEVDTEILNRPSVYNGQSMNGNVQQMKFAQDNLDDKVVTISKTAGYIKAPEILEKPEECHVQSISADFPSQIKSPMQTDFTQDNIVDKVVTTTVSTDYKMFPEMSDMTGELKVQSMRAEFPGLVEGPKTDQSSNQIGTPDMQTHTSYKTVVEKGIKPEEQILSPTIQMTDFSINTKDSQPNVSYNLSGNQPELNTMSLETSHFTLEKPVTSVKTITKTVTTDLNNSSVDFSTDFSVRNGTMQIQQPANTLSQYDPRCVVDSISSELPENVMSTETDVSYSSDFLTLTEPKPLIRQKSWSDVVKNTESVDISDERSQPNISSSISIDKVEISGGRSPYLQQTDNEGRTISGESQAFVIGAPKGTYVPEYANIQSEDVVAPLKAKPMPPNKPLLRKLSGQDFSVADTQKTAKPVLKLVAPDCTLLQTKFETDGWKPKVKSPTATMTTTTTIVQSELISQSPIDDSKAQFAELEHLSLSAPVAPKRRSREFRSVSEDSTDGETASPNTTLHFKTHVDIPPAPQSSQPPVPKRKTKKNRKSDRSSSGSISSDTSGSKNFNVSLNMNGSQPIQHPEFRMSDQDVFRDTHPTPRSPLESETRENFITENIISLNKSPHTSITSDTVDVGNLQEIIIRSPKVTSQPEKEHFEFVLDNSPIEKNPPLERSYSAGKSRVMPGQKKRPSSRDNESDNEEKQEQPSSNTSPDSKTRRWKSTEVLKPGRVKPDIPPKNTGLNRVKSTSVKLLSKLQSKPKKAKSPRPSKDEEGFETEPYDKGHGATREYPTLEKYPGNRNYELSSPKSPNSEKPQIAAVAPVAPLTFPLPVEESDEPVKERVYLSSWDPTPLLKDLYEIRLMDDETEDLSHGFIEMQGLMEKLPMNKKKATLLKTWKRRYFRARNGWLLYYDNRNDDKPSDEVLLMGGQVNPIGNQVIGIDDGRGRYLMVRCPSQKEYEQWLTALQSQTTDNTRATYVRPSINAPNHSSKKVVMIEFGSMSIRAGILKEQATLPQLFFPNVVAISNEKGLKKHVIGFDAYKPDVRHSSKLVQPFEPTDKVDKFKVDFETVPSLFTAIFKDLKIASKDYYVMLILPVNIIDEEKSLLMNILIDQFRVRGVFMAPQALLALYSYNSQSGIIVDIGERIEVLPIFEGFAIDAGHTLQTFGAGKIRQSLRSGLSRENYPLYSPLEQLLVRLVMEQTCFVSKNFKEDCQQYQENPAKFKETVYLKKFNLPEETYDTISHSLSRFVSPEGLFCKDLWGMDYPTIQSLVKDAIEACPMDNRRHLCRSIYLSGGVTLIPGFVNRLEEELSKQLNDTLVIQVHSSPQRYHAAYIGACALCSMPQFEQSCITSEEWKQNGSKSFQKWKMSS